MRFIGVDPGSNFTGVAVLTEDGTFLYHGEYADPVQAWYYIHHWAMGSDAYVVIEDYVGGGYRDTHTTTTIKCVGYLYHRCREAGLEVELVNPQARLSNVANVPAEIAGKDERSAAAHALAYRERNPVR